jgi:hypothetical protein
MEWKRAYLHGIRRAVGLDKYFLSAISPRPRATPELVTQGILISAQCGADALTIGHEDHCRGTVFAPPRGILLPYSPSRRPINLYLRP